MTPSLLVAWLEPGTSPAETQDLSFVELLAKGGLAMWPIYACSVIVVAVFVQKLVVLRGAGLHRTAWFEPVLGHVRAGDFAEAARACRAVATPAARVIEAVAHALDARPDKAESEAKRVGSLELRRLEHGLPLLAFMAQVAPLLGLLGTVLGMVELFMGLQSAEHGNLSVGELASGIWTALLTTAAGLTVAVPALAAHAFVGSRVDAVRMQLADMVERVLFHAPSPTASTSEPR